MNRQVGVLAKLSDIVSGRIVYVSSSQILLDCSFLCYPRNIPNHLPASFTITNMVHFPQQIQSNCISQIKLNLSNPLLRYCFTYIAAFWSPPHHYYPSFNRRRSTLKREVLHTLENTDQNEPQFDQHNQHDHVDTVLHSNLQVCIQILVVSPGLARGLFRIKIKI